MLISVEHEMPAVYLDSKAGVAPCVFIDLWKELSAEGWTPDGHFALSRKVPRAYPGAQKSSQMMSTDTGPTLEIAPSPGERIVEVEQQLCEIRTAAVKKLKAKGIGLLGSGVHPHLGNTLDEYYLYRTPRSVYDYAIKERGHHHRMLLNIAAIQEVIDVPIIKAPSMLSTMHRLAGVFIFFHRNDPALRGPDHLLSVRPMAWRDQVTISGIFPGDRLKVGLPEEEANTWQSYMRLLWDANPMFILGTKSSGVVYIPEHPTFGAFISSDREWVARRLDTGENVYVAPSMSYVAQTDWTYMGFARLRLFWKDGVSLSGLVTAYQGDSTMIEEFLSANLEKVLLENRSSACPPPGEEMCPLALVVGLIENFNEVERFAKARPYSFWLKLASAAEWQSFDSSVENTGVLEILSRILSLSRSGLLKRGLGEERYLEPLVRRIAEKKSPSERMLDFYRQGQESAVIENLLYRL